MGKKDKNKKKGKGAEKTAMKTDKKIALKQKKLLAKIGEADIEEIVTKLEQEEARLKEVQETISSPPTPRSNFTICTHPEKEELIIFGGEFYDGQKVYVYNDLYFYNIPKSEWKLVKSPAGPAPRSSHQMVPVASEGGQLWLFGGEHPSPSQMQFYHFKDLWVLRLTCRKWEKINAPNGPSPRSGHRMIAGKKRLIVFGGFHDNNQSYKYFNDVHMFSLESYTWMKIDVTGAVLPPARSGCGLAMSPDGKILIWGGYSKAPVKKEVDRGITHTDMFALVPDKMEPNTKFKWNSIKAGGLRPLPRSSVGFTIAPNGKVYCFGGVMDIEENEEDLRGQFGNDLYCLDLEKVHWKLLEVQRKEKRKTKKTTDSSNKCGDEEMNADDEDQTEKLAPKTITMDGIFTVTVAGSSSMSTTDANMKNAKDKSKNGPCPRMNAGLTVCKGVLYVFGGIYEEDKRQYTLNDFYSIDLHKIDEWRTIIPNNINAHEWYDSGSENSSEDEESDDDEDDDDSEESSSRSEMDTD